VPLNRLRKRYNPMSSLGKTTEVRLSDLPIDIQRTIPYSIRTKKDIYEIGKLPYNIQYMITEYYERQSSVEYNVAFDIVPYQSKIEDFEVINNYYDLVVEYIRNFLVISRGQYPFDPAFYSYLKYYIHSRDTSTQHTLVNNEIRRIVRIVSTDLELPITVENLDILKNEQEGTNVTYIVNLTVKINNTPKEIRLRIE